MEIKPCPFCGKNASLYVSNGVCVICNGCNARTNILSDYLGCKGVAGNATESVIECWNRRVKE